MDGQFLQILPLAYKLVCLQNNLYLENDAQVTEKIHTEITHIHVYRYIGSNNNINQQMAQCSSNHSECKGFINEFS